MMQDSRSRLFCRKGINFTESFDFTSQATLATLNWLDNQHQHKITIYEMILCWKAQSNNVKIAVI